MDLQYNQVNKHSWVCGWLHDNLRLCHINPDKGLGISVWCMLNLKGIHYYSSILDDNLEVILEILANMNMKESCLRLCISSWDRKAMVYMDWRV